MTDLMMKEINPSAETQELNFSLEVMMNDFSNGNHLPMLAKFLQKNFFRSSKNKQLACTTQWVHNILCNISLFIASIVIIIKFIYKYDD